MFPQLKDMILQSKVLSTCSCACDMRGKKKKRCYININYSINTLNTVKQMQVYAKPSLKECLNSSHKTRSPIFGYEACTAASYTVI